MAFTRQGSDQQTVTTGTSDTVGIGAAPAEGDVVVMWVATNVTAEAIDLPSDAGATWTERVNSNGSASETMRYACFTKIANASEPTTYTSSWPSSSPATTLLEVWRPAGGLSEIDNTGVEQINDDSSNTYEDVLGITVAADALVFIFASLDTNSSNNWNSVDNSFTLDAAPTGGRNSAVFYKEGVGAGSTGTTRCGWANTASERPGFFSLSFIESALPAATISAVSSATNGANTATALGALTLTVDDSTGITGVTVGGVACTSVVLTNSTTVDCVAPKDFGGDYGASRDVVASNPTASNTFAVTTYVPAGTTETDFTVAYAALSADSPFADDLNYADIVSGDSCVYDSVTSPDSHAISMSGDGEFTITGTPTVDQTFDVFIFDTSDNTAGTDATITVAAGGGGISIPVAVYHYNHNIGSN